MAGQMIISVGREYGSGGHIIAEKLSQKFGVPLYDHNLLEEIAKEKNMDIAELIKYDELPKNFLLSRKVNGYSNSPHEMVANMQFDALRKKAANGESFVVVGRCSEAILQEYTGLITIFILADMECKVRRIEQVRGFSNAEAVAACTRHDKKRKAYHNYYCIGKWGDSRNYDVSINSSRLGIDATADFLESYIKARMEKE